jgi:hypothetical protein
MARAPRSSMGKARVRPALALAVVVLGAPHLGRAQVLAERSQPEQRVILAAGWESTWVARLSYARSLGDPGRSAADVSLTVPVLSGVPFSGGRLDVGFNPLLTAGPGLGAAASLRTGAAWSSDALGARVSWTCGALIAPGW